MTVLIWPRYGPDQLDITLDGGKTYEFSAWVRWVGPLLPPDLRVSLPPQGGSVVRSGRASFPGYLWQRYWLHVETKARTDLSYLAVWVRGPGTVWVDDLSLREVVAGK